MYLYVRPKDGNKVTCTYTCMSCMHLGRSSQIDSQTNLSLSFDLGQKSEQYVVKTQT